MFKAQCNTLFLHMQVLYMVRVWRSLSIVWSGRNGRRGAGVCGEWSGRMELLRRVMGSQRIGILCNITWSVFLFLLTLMYLILEKLTPKPKLRSNAGSKLEAKHKLSPKSLGSHTYTHTQRKRPNDSPEFNKTLGKALLLTTLGQSLRFTHATRKSGLEPK